MPLDFLKMSSNAISGHPSVARQCLLLGVSGHRKFASSCPFLTQSGHDGGLIGCLVAMSGQRAHKGHENLTEATGFADDMYAVRRRDATNAGLLWGAYHFLRPVSISAQVDFFLKIAAPAAVGQSC
jgi:hypothetical protein